MGSFSIWHFAMLLLLISPFVALGAAIYWFVVKPRRKAQADYDAQVAAQRDKSQQAIAAKRP